MTTWYVHRRNDGTIASAHEELQPDYATEALDDTKDQEIIDWFAAVNTPVSLTPEQKLATAGLTVNDLKTLLGIL